MLTKTFSGELQYTDPILVPNGNWVLFQIKESVASFSATVSAQWIMDISDPSRPNDTDSRWVTVDAFDVFSAPKTQVSSTGGFWFRLAILTGDYSSGSAEAIIKICP